MSDFQAKTDFWQHQEKIFLEHRDDEYYALLWEMSLGKTKVLLDVAAYRFLVRKDIQALLIIAPNSVYPNWTNIEAPIHLACPNVTFRYRTGSSDEKRIRRLLFLDPREIKDRLRVVAMSYDAMCTDEGQSFAEKLVKLYPTMMVLDESTAIKNRESKRAKTAKFLGNLSEVRWIATGTPAVQSPFDLHSQIEFLDVDFWKQHGLRTWSAFKQEFGIYETQRFGQRSFQKVSGYKNLRFLRELMTPISSRLTKEDSEVKLPPKIYSMRTFELTPKQREIYDSMAKHLVAEIDADPVAFASAAFASTKAIRLQQICSGFVTAEEEIDIDPGESFEGIDRSVSPIKLSDMKTVQDAWNEGNPAEKDDSEYERALNFAVIEEGFEQMMKEPVQRPEVYPPDSPFLPKEVRAFVPERKVVDVISPADNPRLLLLQEILEECDPQKVIVFCRFTRDVELICDMLGDKALRYDGRVKQREREANLESFRDPLHQSRALVCNVHALSMGLTLTIAKRAIYFSNSFSLEKRLQSEDRIHRPGQEVSVQIIDIVAENTYDEKIVEALRRKFDIAREVTGDKLREWILEGTQKADQQLMLDAAFTDAAAFLKAGV